MTTGVFGGMTPTRVALLIALLVAQAVVAPLPLPPLPAFPALGTTDVDAIVSFVHGGFGVGG